MTRIVAVTPVLAPHRRTQGEIAALAAELCAITPQRQPLLERIYAAAGVETRHLALPPERYAALADFGETNDEFLRQATTLGAQAVTDALHASGLAASDVDVIVSTTVTGVAIPSIEARIAAQVGFRPDVRRIPLLGLGCAGGAAGLAVVHEYLLGHPTAVAVLLAVELCSLTLQRSDPSTTNFVASALFGDGAAAVVAVGDDRANPAGETWAGPRVVDTRSVLYPDSLSALGWHVGESGFTVLLGREVPDLVRKHVGHDVQALLAAHDWQVSDVTGWICHPGGPRVLDALRDGIGLPDSALELSWQALGRVGNLSSVAVLHLLHETILQRRFTAETPGMMVALGPGLAAELVLLAW